MSYPTLEQVRTQSNPLQATVVNDYYVTIDNYTNEYTNYKKITTTWTAAKCDGFMYISAGGNCYERVIDTPYLNAKWFGAIGDGNSHPLSSINDPSTGLPFTSLAAAQVYYPTAFSLTNEVDGLAIQNAINFVIYSVKKDCPKTVWIPYGEFLTSDTIQLGYGDNFSSCTLMGSLSLPFDVQNPAMKSASIHCTFSDRPLINIQGGRDALIQGLNLSGINTKTPVYNEYIWNDPTQYVSNGLAANADSQTAPYAGITIDGYGGNAPGATGNTGWVNYPGVNYPVAGNALGINITTQYNKNCTSRVSINNCSITAFIVGVVLQPSGVEANGDFVKLNGCVINTCKYGVSSGGGQARLTQLYQCQVDYCWVAVTNAIHGQQRGRINELVNCHFSGFQVIYFNNSAWNGPISIRDCYGESLFKIGYFGNSNSSSCSIMMENCDWNFDHTKGVPLSWISIGSQCLISIKNTRYTGAYCPIWANNIILEGCTAQIDMSLSTAFGGTAAAAYQNMLQFTGGFPVNSLSLNLVPNKSIKNCILTTLNLSTTDTIFNIGNDLGYENKSELRFAPDTIRGYFMNLGFARNEFRQYDKAVNFTFPTLTTGSRVLTLPIANVFFPKSTFPGDVIVDYGYGYHWLILSKDSNNYYLLMMNGFTNDTSGTGTVAIYETPAVTNPNQVFKNGSYHFVLHTSFNRAYASGPHQYMSLVGDVTAGSNMITGIKSADGQAQNTSTPNTLYETIIITPGSGIGLYFYGVNPTTCDPNGQLSSYQGPYYPTAFDTTNNTIMLDTNSTYTGKVYLFNTSIYK